MGGAGNRQAPLAMAALIGGPTGHEDRRLEGFESRAHEAQRLGISGLEQHPAAAVAHGRMHPMARFNNSIAQQPHL